MWSRPARAFFLGLSALAIFSGVRADQTITVDGQDQSIKYITGNGSSDNATWVTVQRSSDSCDTPQRLTSRLGDSMSYTFTGTGIYVIGTVGVKQGIINFTLDGQNITNFDRGRSQLICDFVLFQSLNLPYQQHTVVATLVGDGLNLQTGLEDGVLSIQRVRYTIPGGGSSSVGPIIGGVVGAVVLIGACGAGWFFWRRHRHPVKNRNRNNAAFWDHDDDINGGGKHATMVATPFEWDGPNRGQAPQQQQGHYGGAEGEQPPGSPTLAASQPLLASGQSPPWSASAYSTSFAGLPHSGSSGNNPGGSSSSNTNAGPNNAAMMLGAGPRTHTSSSSGDRRRASAAAGLVAANPDPGRGEKNAYAMEALSGGGRQGPNVGGSQQQGQRPQQVDDTQLVDRIAQRLADIMTERVGVAGGDAPPSYVGDDGELYGAPPPGPPPANTHGAGPSNSTSYPPAPAQAPINPAKSPHSPQYAQSPPPSAGLQPPITPPSTSTSFGAGPGGRFGPRPRPSGSVSGGRPPSSDGNAVQRGSSMSKDPQQQLRRDSLSPSAPGY